MCERTSLILQLIVTQSPLKTEEKKYCLGRNAHLIFFYIVLKDGLLSRFVDILLDIQDINPREQHKHQYPGLKSIALIFNML